MVDVAVVWYCPACRKPVQFTARADRHDAGWHVHADLPIRVHQKQHEEVS